MILAMNGLGDLIKIPFGYLLDWLYQFTTNYGLSLILFAVLIKHWPRVSSNRIHIAI